MQPLESLNVKKVPTFGLTTVKKRVVKQLVAYYKQGGKWHKVSDLSKKKDK